MSDSGVKIEVHLIQNFAPSNLNRDDTGQPKSATFGCCRRARLSSQCGKRAARQWWRDHSTVSIGDRTKRLQKLIDEKLAQDKEFTKKIPHEEDRKNGIRLFTDAYYAAADSRKPDITNVLIFIGPDEVDVCAKVIKEIWDGEIKNKTALKPRKEIQARISEAQVSADIALFGRMLAEQPGRNTDGACQVAHPISTHRVDMEMDFYTAVDDLSPEEETGAGMMGVVGFNSACYYRYSLVDRDQLARNLAHKTGRKDGKWAQELEVKDYEEADTVIKAFLEAMVYAIPTGKQNSFAAQNLPSFGLFVRRQGGVPISLANAFAKPVRPSKDDDDLVGLSVDRLTRHWDALKQVYGVQGVQTTACFHIQQEGRLNGLSDSARKNVDEAINAVMEEAVRQQ
jgi:CRISPR system Cascade subunit CasC